MALSDSLLHFRMPDSLAVRAHHLLKGPSRCLWGGTSWLGLHPLTWLGLRYRDTIFRFPKAQHPAVAGCVALTIDDGFCRQSPDCCLAEDVRTLLQAHGARATFMVCSDYLRGFEAEARRLLADGCELGNHCAADGVDYSAQPLHEIHPVVETTTREIEAALAAPGHVRWFRAPQGLYSAAMRATVHKLGLRHALADCYCDDFMHDDPKWVAATLLRQARAGSIVLLHMPERGRCEHNLGALRLLLAGLEARGLRAVTLSELAALAEGGGGGGAGGAGRGGGCFGWLRKRSRLLE